MSQAWGGESWSIAEPEPTSGPTTCSLTRMHTHARMFFLMTNGEEVIEGIRDM